ncbi:MAG: Wzz/FepE/Etk N-terminal domain-containing protein [Bacteroidales bacterium]|nr:hypothetical protein [Bacteroidales bacterium]
MKGNIRAEFRQDSFDLLNFFIRHFRKFVIAGIVAAILSTVISLLIRPLYESAVILYPSSNITEATSLLGETESRTALFGDDDATEKLIQVINSAQVREYLKEKYNLMQHYNIKPGEKYPNTLMKAKMDKYMRCTRTDYGSVKIRVRDRDRVYACNMANDMAARADTIFNNLQREAAMVTLDEISRLYDIQKRLVRQYEDSLMNLSSAAALRLYSTFEMENDYLGLMRGRFLEAQALSRQTLPYILVVDRAVVAEKKVFPKRTVMVLLSTVSVLLLLAMVLFIAEGVKLRRADDRQ